MNKSLDALSARMRPLAVELIARAIEAGIQIVIVETLRSDEDQLRNLANGVSWTRHSKHLAGDAIDIAPVAVLGLKSWAPLHPQWKALGELGKKVGLAWGGDWTSIKDLPHFEFKEV